MAQSQKVAQRRSARRTTKPQLTRAAAKALQDRTYKPHRRSSILNGQDPETELYYGSAAEFNTALVALGALTRAERAFVDEFHWMLDRKVNPHLYGETGWVADKNGVWTELPDEVFA